MAGSTLLLNSNCGIRGARNFADGGQGRDGDDAPGPTPSATARARDAYRDAGAEVAYSVSAHGLGGEARREGETCVVEGGSQA